MKASDYWPQWIARVASETSGRDPLGLSRVSDIITDSLLKGIITTTNRARYYSFYTWAIYDSAMERPPNTKRWQIDDHLQRREAAFAIASKLGAPMPLQITGVTAVDRVLQGADTDDIPLGFRVLPSNSLGGFDQYYAGSIINAFQLVRVNENGDLAVDSTRGVALAAAFEEATATSPFVKDNWKRKTHVPLSVLKQSSDLFSLHGVLSPAATNERTLLVEMLFDLGQRPSATSPLNRQATLGNILFSAQCYENAALAGDTIREIDRDLVYWPHYYEKLWVAEAKVKPYQSPAQFTEVHQLWRQFCAHQFFIQAMEEFLAATLDALSPFPNGLSHDALIAQLATKDFEKDLKESLHQPCGTPRDLLKALGILSPPDEAASLKAIEKFGPENAIHEWAIANRDGKCPQSRLGRSVLLLGLLYAKWRGMTSDRGYRLVADHANREWWTQMALDWVETWVGEGTTWSQAIAELLTHVVRRHDQVKFQKRKLEASWLEFENGSYRRTQELSPNFRSTRHHNAVTILHDLGLLNLKRKSDGDRLELSASGKQILQQVMESRA